MVQKGQNKNINDCLSLNRPEFSNKNKKPVLRVVRKNLIKKCVSLVPGLTHIISCLVAFCRKRALILQNYLRHRLPSAFYRLVLTLVFSLGLTAQIQAGEIVLIIDDMGNKLEDSAAFKLPPEVAFAILPHTPYSKSFAMISEAENRDVLIHMPMEALSGLYMGEGGLSSDMSSDVIKDLLTKAHKTIPNAIGVNNHMGSRLTQLTEPMQATMEYLIYHRMFFVDSRTTRHSKALSIAKENGVPGLGRHVFIDHIRETSHIDYQFRRLVRIAKKYGFAVGIAHPHEVTMEYLVVAINALKQEGVTLVNIRDKVKPEIQQWAWNQPGQLSR